MLKHQSRHKKRLAQNNTVNGFPEPEDSSPMFSIDDQSSMLFNIPTDL